MDSTPNLLLPHILPAQAQKFLSHNEGLERLDALVMLTVLSRTESAPPADPQEGDRYVVDDGASGAWAGSEGSVASWRDGGWSFLEPRDGWLAWCGEEAVLLCFADGAWHSTGLGPGNLQNVGLVGVNATADTTNRLTVAAAATLLSHAGASHRLVVNKNASGDTASLILQKGFSARAEIGLTGDDDLHLKVSADGTTFLEALRIDRTTGRPRFPNANFLDGYAINLYQDSGRLAGDAVSGVVVSTFAFPAYLTLYNSTTSANQGKFIHDNNDYGGSSGSLDSEVKALIDQIRDSSHRQFGNEFYVAKLTMGSGTSAPTSHSGSTYYRMVFTAQKIRAPAMTFHVYLKALDDNILVRLSSGQTATLNGVAKTSSFLISPGDGWVSLTVHDVQDPAGSFGYSPEFMVLSAKASGHRVLLACPALMGGIVDVDDNVGIIAGYNSWSA